MPGSDDGSWLLAVRSFAPKTRKSNLDSTCKFIHGCCGVDLYQQGRCHNTLYIMNISGWALRANRNSGNLERDHIIFEKLIVSLNDQPTEEVSRLL